VVSGGFDADRVRRFEAVGVPVDAYGVGSSLLRGNADFTADVVQLEGRQCAKVGRTLRPNPRLERVR
jgi:nicotinate phosphoribosyltransferase